MMWLWCAIVGHRWKQIGSAFKGFATRPYAIIWKCERCGLERDTHPWMRPRR